MIKQHRRPVAAEYSKQHNAIEASIAANNTKGAKRENVINATGIAYRCLRQRLLQRTPSGGRGRLLELPLGACGGM